MEQQKHRDLVNEMYNKTLMGKVEAETERMRPKIPYKGTLVNESDYLKISQLEISMMGTLEKEMEGMRGSGRYTESDVEDYRLSKMGDIGEYTKAKAGGYTKDFPTYQKEIGQSRATRISTGEVVDRAGKTTAARLKATAESEALGADLYNQAVKNLGFSYELEEDPELRDKMLAGEMEKLLGQTFGPKNVSPLLEIPGKGRGFKIRKSDGKTVWKGISK